MQKFQRRKEYWFSFCKWYLSQFVTKYLPSVGYDL